MHARMHTHNPNNTNTHLNSVSCEAGQLDIRVGWVDWNQSHNQDQPVLQRLGT